MIFCITYLRWRSAETRFETVVGTVVDTITLTSTYVRKTPTEKRICRNDDVPIYAQEEGASEIGSMIIGGLIGSAVGNKFSNNDGAGAAGTVAGALIGREHSKNKQKNSRIVGYKQQETCPSPPWCLKKILARSPVIVTISKLMARLP